MFSLDGKIAIVAGGSGYLGMAVCRALWEQGATVIIADLREPVFSELTSSSENVVFDFFKCNFVDEGDVKRLQSYVKNKYAPIDIGVNMTFSNAGKSFYEITAEDWRRGIDVNLTGAFLFSMMCYSLMDEISEPSKVWQRQKSEAKSIIHFSSMYGIVSPDPGVYHSEDAINPIEYGVGKAGVIQMTRYLAVKWAKKGIRVNAIAPGAFPNPDVQRDKDFVKSLERKIPLGRIGIPEEISGAVVFLASDEASYITGQCLVVDGGWTVW